jgi:tripartite-type tricarboxylate transporter receptor subunit TctC
MSHYMPQFIPGHPNMIVQYMPGAGGLKATNYAYNVLPKDGTALLEPPDSIIITQLTDPKHARYQSNKFTWIGNMIDSNSVICVLADTGVKNLAGAEKKQIIVASTGTGSQTYIIPTTLNALFHTKFKIIMGYKGSRGSTHAMEQNEVQGVSLTWLAFITDMPNWFKGSRDNWKALPIVQVGFKKDKDLPFVDLAQDFAKTKEDHEILDFVSTLGPIGRGLAAPPGTPKKFVAALRKAFDQMIKDPAVKADVERRKLRIIPKSGEEVQKVVEQVLKMSPPVVERATKILTGKASS